MGPYLLCSVARAVISSGLGADSGRRRRGRQRTDGDWRAEEDKISVPSIDRSIGHFNGASGAPASTTSVTGSVAASAVAGRPRTACRSRLVGPARHQFLAAAERWMDGWDCGWRPNAVRHSDDATFVRRCSVFNERDARGGCTPETCKECGRTRPARLGDLVRAATKLTRVGLVASALFACLFLLCHWWRGKWKSSLWKLS